MKQKRTKRYGGFLVGDRVKLKKFPQYEGEVVDLGYGRVHVKMSLRPPEESNYSCYLGWGTYGMCYDTFYLPHQLINLTRQEEDAKERQFWEKFASKMGMTLDEYLQADFEATKALLEPSEIKIGDYDWGNIGIPSDPVEPPFDESIQELNKAIEKVNRFSEKEREMFGEYLLANIEAMVEEVIERGKYVFQINEVNSIKLPPKPIRFSPSDLSDTPLEEL